MMEMSNFVNLRPKQEQAIDLLLQGMGKSKVCEVVGISRQTLANWQQDSNFRYALSHARQAALERSANVLAQSSVVAVMTLVNSLQGEPISPQQIRSASLILDFAQRYAESTDLAGQVEELRSAVNELTAAREMENG